MKLRKRIIAIDGVVLILYGLFHAAFWNAFDWDSDLQKISVINSNVMQMLNIGLITLLISLGIVLMIYTKEIANTKLGKALLLTVALFFIVRGISEFIFPESSIISALFIFLTATIFLTPIFIKK